MADTILCPSFSLSADSFVGGAGAKPLPKYLLALPKVVLSYYH